MGFILNNVNYIYKEGFSINNLNIEAKEGDIVCLLGESGCGKSTILRIIAGLEYNVKGYIKIDDLVVVNNNIFIPPEKRNIGFVFQYNALFPHKTAIENVMMGIIDPLSEKEKYYIAEELLYEVGLAKLINSYPHMLSGGQQQRVNIARALVKNPKLILFDEPFTNLDINLKKQVKSKVMEVLKSKNITSVMVTHDPNEALEMADKIYFLQNGSVVQHGGVTDLYYKPVNDTVASFFGLEELCFKCNSEDSEKIYRIARYIF